MCSRSKVFKRCKCCKKMKSLSDYYIDKGKNDKHSELCKKCEDKIKANNL